MQENINKNIGTSGKTIMDGIINNSYDFFIQKCQKICKGNKKTGEELFHFSIEQLYTYYTLDKITRLCEEDDKRIHYYLIKFLNTQFNSSKSQFNKKSIRHSIYIENENEIDLVDDVIITKEKKELNDLLIYCADDIVNNLYKQKDKQFFCNYLYTQLIINNRNINELCKEELQSPTTKVYGEWNEIKRNIFKCFSEKIKKNDTVDILNNTNNLKQNNMCCGREHKNVVNQNVNSMNISKKELSEQIYSFMGQSLKEAGIAMRFTTTQIVTMVQLHNQFFETNLSQHALNDVKQALTNMKALYHSIRRGEIKFEEPIEDKSTEAKPSENESKEIINDNKKEIKEETKEKDLQPNKCYICGKQLRKPGRDICEGCKSLQKK